MDLARAPGKCTMRQEQDLRTQAAILRWRHSIDLGEGFVTDGECSLPVLQAQADIYFRDGLAGKTVLDIGCWDGFNSFEAIRLGAADVLATDHFVWSDKCWGNRQCFELARSLIAPEVRVEEIDIPELNIARVGQFDVVVFAGVIYHLRHPLAALEQIAEIVTDTLILETHLDAKDVDRPAMIFYPGGELADDSTNWWGPNAACITAMLRDVGFREVVFTDHPFEPHTRGIFHARR
jgi:tRNA (mo5U34)-methyltransferase